LPPGSAEVRVAGGYGLYLLVVVGQVHDDFVEAGLEFGGDARIKRVPVSGSDAGVHHVQVVHRNHAGQCRGGWGAARCTVNVQRHENRNAVRSSNFEISCQELRLGEGEKREVFIAGCSGV
jgi:hypothetical protein